MSIYTEAAVQELSKEIERLTAIRDSLLTSPVAPKTKVAAPPAKTTAPATTAKPAPAKKPLSAETKKRIADAQKKRWAKIKKSTASPAKAAAQK